MRADERISYDSALRAARLTAYPRGEFVGQESFMRASEIGALARRAGVGGVRVLDLCCGVAGPGRFITATHGCSYVGVDMSASAIEVARARTAGLSCRFAVATVPPVPSGPFDVVLLLETMLAFPDKQALLAGVSAALAPGGRFAFTVEAGRPLTALERQVMPAAETVWPVPVTELLDGLSRAGLHVRWVQELSRSHRLVADAIADAVVAERSAIAGTLGHDAVRDLVTSHRLWSSWLATGRIRKLALVAQKAGVPPLNVTGRRPV